jgi:3-isopropylmalate/(R)-2-methylmalate dehydratase small subunit
MEPIKSFSSTAVLLPIENIDTDQIIPARFLKVTNKAGLGDALFCDWRYHEDGSPKQDFILNLPESKEAQVLFAGDNFGCGSSREHAPWALVGYGFRAVISTYFADIFRSNALKNGLLPIVLDADVVDGLLARPGIELHVDVAAGTVTTPEGERFGFELDAFARTCLLEGVDQLGYLLRQDAAIERFEAARRHQTWLQPAPSTRLPHEDAHAR